MTLRDVGPSVSRAFMLNWLRFQRFLRDLLPLSLFLQNKNQAQLDPGPITKQ